MSVFSIYSYILKLMLNLGGHKLKSDRNEIVPKTFHTFSQHFHIYIPVLFI